MDPYSYITNAHGSYIEELYRSYQNDPHSVEPSWRLFFEGYDFSKTDGVSGETQTSYKEVQVRYLIHAYRSRGHLKSDTNPVRPRKDRKARLDLNDFGLEEADLETEFDAGKNHRHWQSQTQRHR